MTNFQQFNIAMQAHFETMKAFPLYEVQVSREEMWDTYLNAFPAGTNEIFRERREFDCNCCRQFMRDLGSVVAIKPDNTIITLWDFDTDSFFDHVICAMEALIRSRPISDLFIRESTKIGTVKNNERDADGKETGIVWEHMNAVIPSVNVMKRDRTPTFLNDVRSNKQVFMRSMVELSLDSAETVLDLIKQDSIYRGEEHQSRLNTFTALKREWDQIPEAQQDAFAWIKSAKLGHASKIRNTVIGTLLADLSEGVSLDVSVKKYEDKVAPHNYKRSKALITPRMVAEAQKTVAKLGIEDALPRRAAHADDLTINNVLFADRSSKVQGNAFDQLAASIPVNDKKFGDVAEIGIEKFLSDVLPTATGVEVLLENSHEANLVSLVAPVDGDAPSILKWGNNFSWAYNGDITDSMKERVKAAGGDIDGDLRFSIQWNDGPRHNRSDYDAHCMMTIEHIYFNYPKGTKTGGKLDVDIQDPEAGKPAVENITWANRMAMPEGKYHLFVRNYAKRIGCEGFKAQVEFDGVIHHFEQKGTFSGDVAVANVMCDGQGGFTIIPLMASTSGRAAPIKVWGVNTQTFLPVDMVMFSPNHWDGECVGNRHFFFMLKNCLNPEPVRGFFNEFLRADLHDHRKVFEVLGGQMKAPVSDQQLSGVGFSSTQRNSMTVRVSGSSTRVLKINF